MPEGPEVETVRKTLEPLLVGQTLGLAISSGKKLRSAILPQFAELAGAKILGLGRHGKVMWISTKEREIVVQLGMTGRLVVDPIDQILLPHTHMRINLGKTELRYVDPRRFGDLRIMFRKEREVQVARLGPDPLQWTLAEQSLVVKRIRASQRPIKNILLDQAVLAGVGNIYASEALFGARIVPTKPGALLSVKKVGELLIQVERTLKQAVINNGTTFSSYVDGTGKAGDNLAYLTVFQREGKPCKVCGSSIKRLVQSGRSSFYCSHCQRR